MSSASDSRSLVVKVKHDGTLRRFNVTVTNGILKLTMAELRSKICHLFHLNNEMLFVLTYVDEDADVVTMADDTDLQDAFNQQLNPLRLEVVLPKHDNRTAEEFPETSTMHVQGQDTVSRSSFPQEAMISEAFRKALTKGVSESLNFSKYTAQLTEAIDQAVNFLSSHLRPIVTKTSTAAGVFQANTHNFSLPLMPWEKKQESDQQSISAEEVSFRETLRTTLTKCVEKFLKRIESSQKAIEESMKLASSHLNLSMERNVTATDAVQINHHNERESFPMKENLNSINARILDTDDPFRGKVHGNVQATRDTSAPSMEQGISPNQAPSGDIGTPFMGQDATRKYPLNGDTPAPVTGVPISVVNEDYTRKSHVHGDNVRQVFHVGVQCDGCGMYPILGPRYKSLVRENYDLCQTCISLSGNEEQQYTRLDRPLYRPPRGYRGRRAFSPVSTATPYVNPSSNVRAFSRLNGKLDSRFVQDVTVFDGTQLAPGTSFTKIWRLRNNGSIPWPHQTKLVRVGGDNLGSVDAVQIEIGQQGYPLDEELDVAVDFIAPMQPGRYVSYWRLMAPSGQKFGQRVWVLIQVMPQGDEQLPKLMESLLSLKETAKVDILNASGTTADAHRGLRDFETASGTAAQAHSSLNDFVTAPGTTADVHSSFNDFKTALGTPSDHFKTASATTADAYSSFNDFKTASGTTADAHSSFNNFKTASGTPFDHFKTASGTTANAHSSFNDFKTATEKLYPVCENVDLDNFFSHSELKQKLKSTAPKLMESLMSFKETAQAASPFQLQGTAPDANASSVQALSGNSSPAADKMDIDNFFSHLEVRKQKKSNEWENVLPLKSLESPKEIGTQVNHSTTASQASRSSSPKSMPRSTSSFHANVPASAPSLTEADNDEDFTKEATVEEENLLNELIEMGFTEKSKNLEFLRKNKHDISKTLDDLCGAADWDPILEELQEMGFHDMDQNKKLLMKNEGSVKRAVLDLISSEKGVSPRQSNLSKKAKQS